MSQHDHGGNEHGGFVKLYWKVRSSLVHSDVITFAVWCELLLRTARRRQLLRNGDVLEAGQCLVSTKELADWAKVSSRTLRRYLQTFEREKMITVLKSDRNGTLVSICNWSTYNETETDHDRQRQRNGNATATQRQRNGTQTEKPKNPKNPKSPKKKNAFAPARFADFWASYPRKVAKAAAGKAYGKACLAIRATGRDNPEAWLVNQCRRFAESPKGRGAFVPYPATWLTEGRYDDDMADWHRCEGQPGPAILEDVCT